MQVCCVRYSLFVEVLLFLMGETNVFCCVVLLCWRQDKAWATGFQSFRAEKQSSRSGQSAAEWLGGPASGTPGADEFHRLQIQTQNKAVWTHSHACFFMWTCSKRAGLSVLVVEMNHLDVPLQKTVIKIKCFTHSPVLSGPQTYVMSYAPQNTKLLSASFSWR